MALGPFSPHERLLECMIEPVIIAAHNEFVAISATHAPPDEVNDIDLIVYNWTTGEVKLVCNAPTVRRRVVINSFRSGSVQYIMT